MARPTPTQTRELDRAARSLRHEITQIRELLEAVCAARRRARHVRRRPVSRGLSGWRCEDQGELFAETPDPGRAPERPAKLRTIGHLSCPRCRKPRVAILAGPGHRIYGVHYIETYGKLRIPCGISGARVCEIPRRTSLPASGFYDCPHESRWSR